MTDPARRRLHLHIGLPRTAGTAFRMFLLRSAEVPLAQRGLFAPFGSAPHAPVTAALMTGRISAAELAADLDRLAAARPLPVQPVAWLEAMHGARTALAVLVEPHGNLPAARLRPCGFFRWRSR